MASEQEIALNGQIEGYEGKKENIISDLGMLNSTERKEDVNEVSSFLSKQDNSGKDGNVLQNDTCGGTMENVKRELDGKTSLEQISRTTGELTTDDSVCQDIDGKEIEQSREVEPAGYIEENCDNENAAGSTGNEDVTDIEKEETFVREVNPPKLGPLWENFILGVSGFHLGYTKATLKQFLSSKMNTSVFRIRPRVKTDTVQYVHFRNGAQMRAARNYLNSINKKLITVKVVESPHLKRMRDEKNSDEDENDDDDDDDDNDEPAYKKKKLDSNWPSLEGCDNQVKLKMNRVVTHLRNMDNSVSNAFPKYGNLLHERRQKNSGMICEWDQIKTCPPDKIQPTVCTFTIGWNEETGKPGLGLYSRVGVVKSVTNEEHNYPDHVVEALQVFEKVVQASDKAPVCPPGPPGQNRFWHKLVVHTNEAKDLMFIVFVRQREPDEMKRVNEDIKEFFENGEGKDCNVSTIYMKPINPQGKKEDRYGQTEVVLMTRPFEHTFAGFKFQLDATKLMWNYPEGAEMLCKALEELVVPTKKTTVLEVGCGIGLFGFYLSKLVGEVLSVVLEEPEEVEKNAKLNDITNCQYFDKDDGQVISKMAENITFGTVCAVVMSNEIRSLTTHNNLVKQLRKIEQLKRIVLITEMSMPSPLGPIMSLTRPIREKRRGDPFFPVKVIPVDTMPGSKGYVLLTLLERIDLTKLPKRDYSRDTPKFRGKLLKESYGTGPKQATRQFEGKGKRKFRRSMYDKRGNRRAYNNFAGDLPNIVDEFTLREIMRRNREQEIEQLRMRSRGNIVQNLIEESLREAAVSQLSADATVKLKEMITEAIKNAGVLVNQDNSASNFASDQYNTDNFSISPYGTGVRPQSLLGLQLEKPSSSYQKDADSFVRSLYDSDTSTPLVRYEHLVGASGQGNLGRKKYSGGDVGSQNWYSGNFNPLYNSQQGSSDTIYGYQDSQSGIGNRYAYSNTNFSASSFQGYGKRKKQNQQGFGRNQGKNKGRYFS